MTATLITDALIVDGTGAAPYTGHVLVNGDRIAATAPAEAAEGRELFEKGADVRIDGRRLALSPGFIDCHSHFDWVLPLEDHETFLFPMAEQGVTTVVAGNCGFSPAPVPRAVQPLIQQYSEMLLERPLDYRWETVGEFLDTLASADGLLFNLVEMVGHGTIQISATGSRTARPGADARQQMARVTEASFDQGAAGLSLGLMYPPGIFSTREELADIVGIAARRERMLTVHKRALSRYSGSYPIIPFIGRPHNLKALEEVLAIGLETGVRLQISHFIFVGRASWPTAPKALEMIEAAAAKGLDVKWDIYPHTCGNSYLDVFLSPWFIENLAENLDSPKAIRRLRFELALAKRLLGFDMSDVWIMDAAYPAGEAYNGRCLTEIAAAENTDPVAMMLRIVKESDSKALQLTYGYSGDDDNEALLETLVAHPRSLFQTDTILKSRGFANPASYGAFPRILGRFVRDRGALPLEAAVHRMTGATANWMGIADRGEIRPGAFADLVLFDPDTIADTTTRQNTASRPRGIHKVFCNGTLVVDQGRYRSGTKPGRVLRAGT